MKHRILLGTLIAAVLATMGSCVKTSDIALLTHMNNLNVVGEFNPELGLPVGYAKIQSRDLMNDIDFGGHNVTLTSTAGVMTFTFDTSWTKTVALGSKGAKTADTLNRTAHGEFAINLFEAVGNVLDSVDLKEILMSLNCNLKPTLDANTRRLMNAYNVRVTLDKITLKGIGKDGASFDIREYATPTPCTNEVTQNGFNWLIFDREDIIAMARHNMQKMTVDVEYTAVAPNVEGLVVGEGLNASVDLNQWLTDNVKLESVTLTADVNVTIPFKCHVNGMHQSMDVKFNINEFGGGSSEGGLANAIDFDVDSGYLVIEVVNGMPLDVDMSFVVDSNGQNALSLLNAPQRIPGAKMTRNGDSFYSKDTSNTTIFVLLNRERMASLRSATTMHVNANVSTGSNMMPGEAYDNTVPVALRNEDQMQLRLYVIARAALSVNLHMGAKSILVK